ncbi:sulfotransferase [Microbulbifer harenosus]|uniref:Tetratricopeptide repeat protein n=1 Tax=Microbulbifer harenosus TaxID=2576840 RepID=A0ABY2UKK1_9GAMM|nr:sulfotransferase [Microbulbifer harenosus]TLM78972.1 tetratricopeptide repeat protein [Microbulbifer harenosus]
MSDSPLQQQLNLARQAAARRDWREASRLCIDVLRQDARQADAHLILGCAAGDAGAASTALRAFRTALTLAPERGDIRLQLARCLVQSGEHMAGECEADTCASLIGEDASQLDLLATIYSHLGKQEKAAPYAERAVAIAPDNATLLSNAAAILVFLGRTGEAEAYLRRALQLAPRHFRSHWQLAQLRRAEDELHYRNMLVLSAHYAENGNAQAYLHYAMGKVSEDLGLWQQAWRHYARGAEYRRRDIRYRSEEEQRLFAALRQGFTEEWFCRGAETPSTGEAPIFIVSLPRAGSTLVERIVGSHSQVQSLGELPHWPLVVKKQTAVGGPPLYSTEIAAAASTIDPVAAARDYCAAIRHRRDQRPFFTDKLPGNFLYLPMLARAFPGARFVHVARHPMDAGFAMYKQLFADAYPWSYDLEELGQYYVQYHQLMQQWARLLQQRMVTVNYDALVAAPETETRALLHGLGLPFEDACLQPHKTPNPAATASAIQVREPVHRRSSGRWQHFAAQLQPYRDVLENAGVLPLR